VVSLSNRRLPADNAAASTVLRSPPLVRPLHYPNAVSSSPRTSFHTRPVCGERAKGEGPGSAQQGLAAVRSTAGSLPAVWLHVHVARIFCDHLDALGISFDFSRFQLYRRIFKHVR